MYTYTYSHSDILVDVLATRVTCNNVQVRDRYAAGQMSKCAAINYTASTLFDESTITRINKQGLNDYKCTR